MTPDKFNFALALLLTLAAACGSGDPPQDTADAGGAPAPDASAPEPEKFGETLFDPQTLNTVDIIIDESDWDALRSQTRSFFSALAGDCQAQPFDKPWTYFEAEVTINGITVENVGIRKKGFIGSLSSTKPSLKIKFDEFVVGQKLDGLERMTLNNQQQDPTLINACLGYGIFREAGIVAPRCNFALVTLNGESLGIYAHVDSLKKQFVRFNYDDDEGNLWEGTLSDFRENWTGTFELKTNSGAIPSDLEDMAQAAAVSDAELISSLSSQTDLQRFYRFWAAETVLGHWDGYTGNSNNFYFYRHPLTGLFDFVPWGADALFRQRISPYASVQARSQLALRLYRNFEGQVGYFSAIADLLNEVWNETEIVDELERMVAMVRPHVPTNAIATFDTEVEATRSFILGRRAEIMAELALPPPAVPELPIDFCFDRLGSVTLTMDTQWNAGAGNLGTGTATIDVPGTTLNIVLVESMAMESNGKASLFIRADLDDGNELLFNMTMPLSEIKPGGTADMDWVQATGELLLKPPGGVSTLTSRLAKGSIEVSQGSTSDLAQVQLSLSADLHALGL